MSARAALALLMLVLMAGCTKPARVHLSDDVLRTLPVVEIVGERRLNTSEEEASSAFVLGTGVALGDGLMLTCRHVLTGADQLWIEGRREDFRALAWGEGGRAFEGDWILVETESLADAPRVTLDTTTRLRWGDPVYIAGFPSSSGRALTVLETRLTDAPATFDLDRGHYVFCDRPADAEFSGLSGGAVARWDEQTGTFVVIGLYLGNWGERLWPFPERKRAVVQLLRAPALVEALQGERVAVPDDGPD